MARAFNSNTLNLLRSAALAERWLFVCRLTEGSYGFWNDVFDVSFPNEFPNVTFTGTGSLLSVTDVVQTQRQTIQSLTVVLSGLDTQVLATVGQYNLHAGTVELAKALYSAETRGLVAIIAVFRGYIDRDVLIERPDGETITSALSLTCESRAMELDRATHRVRSNTDQKRWSAGDRGMEWTNRTGTRPIPWGREDESGGRGLMAWTRRRR